MVTSFVYPRPQALLPTCVILLVLVFTGTKHGAHASSDTESKLEALISWLQSRGMEIGTNSSRVEAVVEPDTLPVSGSLEKSRKERASIGVIAKSDISPGDIIVCIPGAAVVSSDKLLANEHAEAEVDGWLSSVTLTTWILKEKALGEKSEWAPYINILPAVMHFPLFLKPEDKVLEEFQSLPFVRQRDDILKQVRVKYDEVVSHRVAQHGSTTEEEEENMSYDDFLWAMANVFSRSFGTNDDKEGQERSEEHSDDTYADALLVPFADLLNHENDNYHTTWKYNKSTGEFCMPAVNPAVHGHPVMNNYGAKDNAQLLLSYGFMVPHNRHDSCQLLHKDSLRKHYLRKGYLHGQEFTPLDDDWADYVAGRAMDEVAGQLASLHEEGSVLDKYVEGSGMVVRYGGEVEPRLVAALAAIAHYDAYRNEPDYSPLAEASIALSHGNVEHFDCHQLEEYGTNISFAVHTAVSVIYHRVEDLLDDMGTSVEQDEQLLVDCAGTQGRFNVACSHKWSTHPVEMESAVKFRLSQKYLLTKLNERLLEQCGDEDNQEVEEGGDENELIANTDDGTHDVEEL